MKVSYLVTLFNKALFVPHLLAGLAEQEGDFERQFVFVDDGSTDGTLSVLREMTAAWEGVVILSQGNSGPAKALNAGLRLVDGDFVKPVDGDDRLMPWATKVLLEACAACGTDYAYAPMEMQGRYAEIGLEIGAAPEGAVREVDFLGRALRRAVTNPSVWIARADLLRTLGGSDPAVFVQDYSLELRLAGSGAAARVEGAVMASPMEAPGRLSTDEAQTLHDVNLALLRFLRANPGLDEAARRFGMRRAAGRSWKWARRHGGVRPRLAWAVMAARMGVLQADLATEALLCAPFRAGGRVRLV